MVAVCAALGLGAALTGCAAQDVAEPQAPAFTSIPDETAGAEAESKTEEAEEDEDSDEDSEDGEEGTKTKETKTKESKGKESKGKESGTKAKETTSRKPSATRGPDVPVNPAAYERAGMSVFTYDLGSYSGTCAISPHGATCQGRTPADAPTVTAVPLPPRKADAIYTGDDGMHFTVFEGVGPSQGRVEAGQSITVEENSCWYPTDDTLRCRSRGNTFTIEPDGTIATDGQLDPPPVWTLPDYY